MGTLKQDLCLGKGQKTQTGKEEALASSQSECRDHTSEGQARRQHRAGKRQVLA